MSGTDRLGIDKLDIVIRHAGSKVVAGIPQIALYATAETVADALQILERKKNETKNDIAAAGIVDPVSVAAGAGLAAESIGRFAIKAGIVAVMMLFVLAVSGALLANRIESVGRGIVGADLSDGRQVWVNLENNLEKLALPANDMPEERKQKLLSNIRVVVNRLRPFVAEIAPLFTPPPAGR